MDGAWKFDVHCRRIVQHWLGWMLFAAAGVGLWQINAHPIQSKRTGGDIYFMWLEGERLANGINPYERILSGDMEHNKKYPTYMPTIYVAFAAAYWGGHHDFELFLRRWRQACVAFIVAVGAVLYGFVQARRGAAVALMVALFWMFNRWTLHNLNNAAVEGLAILLLIASLLLVRRNLSAALMLFGVSLSVKHMALFLAPLYLIWAWHQADDKRFWGMLKASALLACVPVLISLPFLIWEPEGFVRSMLFSATRLAPGGSLRSLDVRLGMVGIIGKLPMLGLLCVLYFAAWRRNLGHFEAALAGVSVFVLFNSVFFSQYICWLVPLVCLVACDTTLRATSLPYVDSPELPRAATPKAA
jgi:uncharacterized membrane protein